MFRVPWVDDEGKVQGEPRIPRGVQLRYRPLQGRPALNPTGDARHAQVPRFRADLQERPHHPAHGRRQGRLPTSTPRASPTVRSWHSARKLHDRALPPHRPQHRRACGRPRRRRAREIGYLFGQYKRLRNEWSGVLTGKGLTFGGSLARTEATGYGLVYFVDEYLKSRGDSFAGKKVVVHGSGNVAIYAIQKVSPARGTVIACSDTKGWVEDPAGIELYGARAHLQQENAPATIRRQPGPVRGRASRCQPGTRRTAAACGSCPADIALPCARENTLLLRGRRGAWWPTAARSWARAPTCPPRLGGDRLPQGPRRRLHAGKAANARRPCSSPA